MPSPGALTRLLEQAGHRVPAKQSFRDVFMETMDPAKIPLYNERVQQFNTQKPPRYSHGLDHVIRDLRFRNKLPADQIQSWDELLRQDAVVPFGTGTLSDFALTNPPKLSAPTRISTPEVDAKQRYSHYAHTNPTQMLDIYGDLHRSASRIGRIQGDPTLQSYEGLPPKIRLHSDDYINQTPDDILALKSPAQAYYNMREGQRTSPRIKAGVYTPQELAQNDGISLHLPDSPQALEQVFLRSIEEARNRILKNTGGLNSIYEQLKAGVPRIELPPRSFRVEIAQEVIDDLHNDIKNDHNRLQQLEPLFSP